MHSQYSDTCMSFLKCYKLESKQMKKTDNQTNKPQPTHRMQFYELLAESYDPAHVSVFLKK